MRRETSGGFARCGLIFVGPLLGGGGGERGEGERKRE